VKETAMGDPVQNGPSPDYEKDQFESFGLDNKIIRRMFIRKVNTDTEQSFMTAPIKRFNTLKTRFKFNGKHTVDSIMSYDY